METLGKADEPLRFGVVGLGVGAGSVLPALAGSPYSQLVAGADVDGTTLARFAERYPDARACRTVEELCADPHVEAVWIATPTILHEQHAVFCARHRKHVVVSKPFTTDVAAARRVVDACAASDVRLVVGHSLGFSPAILKMAQVARHADGPGPVRAIQMMAFTDWMLLPRTPDELDESKAGGLLHRQSPHQVDAARLLGGGMVESVSAFVGNWMPSRPAPGFFAAMLHFADGAVATISHNGYGFFVGAELPSWGKDRGISGLSLEDRNVLRARIEEGATNEIARKSDMRIGGASPLFGRADEPDDWLPMHLGLTVVSCEHGDMRHSPRGIYVYDRSGRRDIETARDADWFGVTETRELYESVRNGAALVRDGLWGLATVEVCEAIRTAAVTRTLVPMRHQVPVRSGAFDLA